MAGPHSSYSCLEIHICWKVDREARMEPPIHTEYFRSGGAITFTFTELGAMEDNSFVIRSARPAGLEENMWATVSLIMYVRILVL